MLCRGQDGLQPGAPTHGKPASRLKVMSKAQTARSKKPVGRTQDRTPRVRAGHTRASAGSLATKIALLFSVFGMYSPHHSTRQRVEGRRDAAAELFLPQQPSQPQKPHCNKEPHRGIHMCNSCAQHTPDTRTLMCTPLVKMSPVVGLSTLCTPFRRRRPPTHTPPRCCCLDDVTRAAPQRDHTINTSLHIPTHTRLSLACHSSRRRQLAPTATQPPPNRRPGPQTNRAKKPPRGFSGFTGTAGWSPCSSLAGSCRQCLPALRPRGMRLPAARA